MPRGSWGCRTGSPSPVLCALVVRAAPARLIGTSTVLGAAETYLLVTRLSGGDLDQYEQWLATTWTRLAAASASPAAQG